MFSISPLPNKCWRKSCNTAVSFKMFGNYLWKKLEENGKNRTLLINYEWNFQLTHFKWWCQVDYFFFYNKHFTSLMVLNVFNFFIFYRSKIQIVKRKTDVRSKVKLFKWSLFYFYLNKMESKSKSTEGNQRIYHQNSSPERHNSFNTKRIVISNRKVCSRSEEL